MTPATGVIHEKAGHLTRLAEMRASPVRNRSPDTYVYPDERWEGSEMEVLVLGFVALALVLTFFAIALKLFWIGTKILFGLIALPFKLLGALVGGVVGLALAPIAVIFLVLLVVGIMAGLLLLPILVPVVLVGLGLALIVHAC
jgi:hypothetical protein